MRVGLLRCMSRRLARCDKVVVCLRYTGHRINVFGTAAGHVEQRQRTDPTERPGCPPTRQILCAEALDAKQKHEEPCRDASSRERWERQLFCSSWIAEALAIR